MSGHESSPALEAQLELLKTIIVEFNASRYTSVAGYVIILYDWVLTLDVEVDLVWPAPLSLVKVLFFVNRWFAPLSLGTTAYQMAAYRPDLSDSECKIYLGIAAFAQLASTFCSTWLLVLRVGALYGRNKRLMIPLYTLFIASYATAAGFTIFSAVVLISGLEYSPIIHSCVTRQRHPLMSGVFMATIFFEIVVVGLTIYKAIEHARIMKFVKSAPFLSTLYRDGLLYFLLIVGLRAWNVTIWLTLPLPMTFLGVYFLWASVTALVSRFFLNLRVAGRSNSDWVSAGIDQRHPEGTHQRRPTRTIGSIPVFRLPEKGALRAVAEEFEMYPNRPSII